MVFEGFAACIAPQHTQSMCERKGPEVKRLSALKAENAKPRKKLVEHMLDEARPTAILGKTC